MRGTFIYFCINEMGMEFNFRTQALLDIGMPVKDENGIDGIIKDMTYDEPLVSCADLAIDYELARAMSM